MDAKIDRVSQYYHALIGETFEGTQAGTFNRQEFLEDDTAVCWHKIALGSMSPEMDQGLKDIVSKFEGRIWKGFHNGVMYINPEDHSDMRAIQRAREFKITDFKILPFDKNCKEPEKYTYQFGCCFILEPLK